MFIKKHITKFTGRFTCQFNTAVVWEEDNDAIGGQCFRIPIREEGVLNPMYAGIQEAKTAILLMFTRELRPLVTVAEYR